MKIVVIGPTLLAKRCLEAMLENGEDEIAAVFTLKDKYASKKARFAIFDDLAEKHKFKLYKVDHIGDGKNIEIIQKIDPDLILELAWSQVLPEEIIKIPKRGCVGAHAAMLPKNRGGASLNWALIKGEKDWGVSLHYLDRKIDTGSVIAQKALKIDERDTIVTLHDKSDLATIELLMENLPLIREDKIKAIEQDNSKVTYLSARKPIEGFIIWDRTAKEIYDLVRALTGDFPGAFVFLNDKKLLIWEAEIADFQSINAKPGEIIDVSHRGGIIIQTGGGFLLVRRVQLEGGVMMWADDFVLKYNLQIGDILGSSLKFTKEAEKWLVDSGIQDVSGDDVGGRFNAWYDLKNRVYSFNFPEITGFGITTLLYLNSLKENDSLLKSAKTAADWLINHDIIDCGGILGPNRSFDSGMAYTFDAGMVLFGMANIYKLTAEEKYLKVAKKIGDFLLSIQRTDGLFEPIYNSKTNEFINTDEKWSTQSGSFHAKLSLGLLALYDVTNDERYKESAIRICDASLRFQEEDGRFITFRDTAATHMHPHCYTCEGLYYTGKKIKNDAYIKAALKGITWSLKSQLPDGGMPCIYDKKTGFNRNQRSDTLAQVLRLAVCFLDDGVDSIKNYKPNIYNLASKLLSFQKTEDGQAGGFYYGYEDGKKFDHINAWCTMFGVQALTNLDKYLNNQKISIDYFI